MTAKLDFSSFHEINGSPETLLAFAEKIEKSKPWNMHITSFMEKEISVGGKPFSMTKQMTNLELQDWDLDDLSPESMKKLHEAAKILQTVEPTWDIKNYFQDPRIGRALEAVNGAQEKTQTSEASAKRFISSMMDVDKPALSAGIQFRR